MTDIIPIPAIIDIDGKADIDAVKDSHLQILSYKQNVVDKNVKLLDAAISFFCSTMLQNAAKQQLACSGIDFDVEAKCIITDIDDTHFGWRDSFQEPQYMRAVLKSYLIESHQKSKSCCELFDIDVNCDWLHPQSYVKTLMACSSFMQRCSRASANKLILRWMLFCRLFTMYTVSSSIDARDPYRFAPMRTELAFKCLQTNDSSSASGFFQHAECTIDVCVTLEVPHFDTLEELIAELGFEGLDLSKVL